MQSGSTPAKPVPRLLYSLQWLQEEKREASKLFGQGKFDDAVTRFRSMLQALTLAVAGDAEEEGELNTTLDLALNEFENHGP